MVWFFERESERLQYEIRHEQDGPGYELVISASADEKTVEKVTSPAELIERSQDVWTFLLNGGWRPLDAQTPPAGRPVRGRPHVIARPRSARRR